VPELVRALLSWKVVVLVELARRWLRLTTPLVSLMYQVKADTPPRSWTKMTRTTKRHTP